MQAGYGGNVYLPFTDRKDNIMIRKNVLDEKLCMEKQYVWFQEGKTMPGSRFLFCNNNLRKLVVTVVAAVCFAAFSVHGDMCYGQRGNESYSWATVANWLNHDDTGMQLYRLPTEEDNVHIWGSSLKWTPLAVESGTVALTRDFSIGHNKGSGRKILFEIESGGVMTNFGYVVFGNGGKGTAGVATLRNGGEWVVNGWVYIGKDLNNDSLLNIESGGRMVVQSGEFVVGDRVYYGALVTNSGEMAVYDFFSGGYGNGSFVNEGNLTITRKLTIGRQDESIGFLHQKSGTLTKTTTDEPIRIGYKSRGTFVVDTPITLVEGDRMTLGENGGAGELVVNDGGSVTGLGSLEVGSNVNYEGSRGCITLAGGEVKMQTTMEYNVYTLNVGGIDENGEQKTFGTIRGYGKIGRDETDDNNPTKCVRISMSGQVVADGGDLDLGLIKTVNWGSDNNLCGTNGWYAVNGGRLILPRRQTFHSANIVNIGDYVSKSDLSLVNSLQLRLYKDGVQLTDSKYNFAMLYAPDREDIPGALPCDVAKCEKVLAVWRLGHFRDYGDVGANPGNPEAFDTVSLRFRFESQNDMDWGAERISLYRYDGSVWRRVGDALESAPNHVATMTEQPSYDGTRSGDNWNIGWYAIVRNKKTGLSIIFR